MSEEIQKNDPALAAPAPENWLARLRKSKYRPIVVLGVSNLAFLPMVQFSPCLALLLLVVIIGVLLWLVRIDNIWHQLMVGTVTLVVAGLLTGAMLLPSLYSLTEEEMSTLDGVEYQAGVSPIFGDTSTSFNYTISVPSMSNNASTIVVNLVVFKDTMSLTSTDPDNYTMHLYNITGSNGSYVFKFNYETQIPTSINAFLFNVNKSGNWFAVGILQNGDIYAKYGPMSSNPFSVYAGTLGYAFYIMIYGFIQFIIIVLFLRFSAKSRDAREKMMADYKSKQQAARDGLVKDKGPAAKEETFVCSECGADVAASAKFCPNCGEPFDEDGTDKK